MSESKDRNEREIVRRRERGEPFDVLQVHSKKSISGSFWGQAWCRNLEAYSDYEYRLPAGRRYLRAGNVYDLGIEAGEVFAYVTGAEIYEVLIRIEAMEEERWEALKATCGGSIESLVDLLGGNLGDSVLERVVDLDNGLFPSPDEIQFSCTCPDWADMCKHVAATMYGIGVQLDEKPELFFKLRQIDEAELLSSAFEITDELTASSRNTGSGGLRPDNLGEIFGIEISDPESAFPDP